MTGLQETLESFGCKLTDRGIFWHSTAPYRNGDNETALQIYKDSGVWRDFVEGTQMLPFAALVERVTGKRELNVPFTIGENAEYEREESLAVGKTFPDSILDRLLPNYSFYMKKGVSQQVLEYYRCGLATNGKMYQRLVFPIFNDAGQISGFAGRDMLDSPERKKKKWKILGQKKNFKYPFNICKNGKFPFRNKVLNADTVILIESIGDSLALSEAGLTNHLVCFGTAISPAVLSCLTSSNCQRILLCFNNDKFKDDGDDREDGKNPGEKAGEKAKTVLNRYFYDRDIVICELPKKDFGCMTTSEIKAFYANITADPA